MNDEWERFSEELPRATMGESDDAERFRTALEKIRDYDPDKELGTFGPGGVAGWMHVHKQLKEIATEALKEAERPNGQ
jgi:hypothetical protein